MYTDVVDPSINYAQDKSTKLKKACDDFEALFLSQMFKTMRETVPQDGLIKQNQGEQIFTQMMDTQVAQDFTKNRSVGLSDMLYKSMSKYVDTDQNSGSADGQQKTASAKKTLDKTENKNTNGNNFPKAEKSTGTSQDFLNLRQKLNGTDVASDMLIGK